MISRRAEVGSARTRLLPAWIARGSLLAKRSKSLLSISLSLMCRRSDPITAGRRKRTLAAILRTPMRANAAQSGSRQSCAVGHAGQNWVEPRLDGDVCADQFGCLCEPHLRRRRAGFKRGSRSWIKRNQPYPSLDQGCVGGQQVAVPLGNPSLGDEGHPNPRLQEKPEHVVSHVQNLGNRLKWIARWAEIHGGWLLAFAAQLVPQLGKRIGVECDPAFARVRQVAAGVTVAALVSAACRQVDRRNVCQAGQTGRREHCRFSLYSDYLSHGGQLSLKARSCIAQCTSANPATRTSPHLPGTGRSPDRAAAAEYTRPGIGRPLRGWSD